MEPINCTCISSAMLSPIRCTCSYYPLKFRTAVVVSRRSRHKQNSIGSIVISHACICILVIFCCVPIHGKECQYRMNVSQSSAIIGIANLQYCLSKPTGRNYIFKTNASCMKTSVFYTCSESSNFFNHICSFSMI